MAQFSTVGCIPLKGKEYVIQYMLHGIVRIQCSIFYTFIPIRYLSRLKSYV